MNLFRNGIGLLALITSMNFGGSSSGESIPEATNFWVLRFPSAFNSSTAAPAIARDGTIYAGTFQGKLLAITPQGGLKWTFDVNCEIKSSPAIADDGTIYFGSRNRRFYALTPDGKLKWMFPTGGWVDSSPAIAVDGTIYFGSADKQFYALNPDGSEKWKFPVRAIVDSSPAITADGTIYFGAHDKKLYALNANGTVRWTFSTGGPIVSSPAIGANGSIYFSSTDGNLYSLKSDGTERWQYHTGGVTESSPVLDEEGNIYLGVNQNVFQKVSHEGKFLKLWPAPLMIDQTVAVAEGRIYTSMPWRMFYALKPDDIKPVWQLKTQNNLSSSPVIGPDGTVYLVFVFDLYAVRPADGALPTTKSSWPMFRANAQHTGRVGH
jgi:outer membrane protein assembly factor BamB